jgi:Icc protein
MREPLTRRRLLAAASAGAAALAVDPTALGAVRPRVRGGFEPELVTVTERGMAAWWPTEEEADTTLRIARADGSAWRELRLERHREVHVAAVDDLEPGTTYRYELRSGGRRMPRTEANPGRFTTLAAPEGRLLATVAVMNDLHVGEDCSGTITSAGGSSVPPCFTAPDYAYRMTRAAVRDVNRRHDVDLVLANGDLTDRGRPDEVRRAVDLLGTLDAPVRITRGNHDRRLPEATECGPLGDCLAQQTALTWVHRVGDRLGVVGLDSCDPDTGEGRLDHHDQLGFLDRALAELRAEGRHAIVAFHHHITHHANATHPPPLFFGVRADRGGQACLDVLARHPHVVLALHGHTHRNYVSYDPQCGARLPFLENGATKEYPAGYAILRVHEDGLVREFHRMTDRFAREWVRTTAGQIWGRHAQYTRGTLASRSFVHRFDAVAPDVPPSVLGPVAFAVRPAP